MYDALKNLSAETLSSFICKDDGVWIKYKSKHDIDVIIPTEDLKIYFEKYI